MSESTLEKVVQGWRGVRITSRPALMRAMADRFGASVDAIDGTMLDQCIYCKSTEECKAYLESGAGPEHASFCPNARRFRAASVITKELA